MSQAERGNFLRTFSATSGALIGYASVNSNNAVINTIASEKFTEHNYLTEENVNDMLSELRSCKGQSSDNQQLVCINTVREKYQRISDQNYVALNNTVREKCSADQVRCTEQLIASSIQPGLQALGDVANDEVSIYDKYRWLINPIKYFEDISEKEAEELSEQYVLGPQGNCHTDNL